jgi:hypothetical protein
MSQDKSPRSDRFQIMTAVALMSLFAIVILVAGLPKGSMTNFVCSYVRDYDGFSGLCSDRTTPPTPASSDQLIASKINSVCLDDQGLKISAAFDEPLTGVADIQVFSTGDDYFPSEQGLADSFKISMTIPTAVDHLDLVIPVDAMPVGIQIFGNIFVSEEGVSSHLSYFLNVFDCSTIGALPSQLIPIDSPIIHSATCLPSRQLMIAFEFEESVPGQYQVLVADIPYQLASVINQPAMLFFSGEPPPEGPIVIRLVSATDQEVVFEDSYTPPVCGIT